MEKCARTILLLLGMDLQKYEIINSITKYGKTYRLPSNGK